MLRGTRTESVNKLRAELQRRQALDALNLTDDRLWRIVNRIGDIGITADALLMYPRPLWLVELAGAYPINLTAEMTNPSDTASFEDWGHSGTAPT